MDVYDPMNRRNQSDRLTPEERVEIEKQEEELLAGWFRLLSAEEASTWVDAHLEDLARKMDQAERELADFDAVMRIVAGTRNPLETLERVWKKEHRTLAEAEALDAFKRIKYKLIRLVMVLDPINQRIVDLLEASETKPKVEYEAMLAKADSEMLGRLKRITGKDWGKRP